MPSKIDSQMRSDNVPSQHTIIQVDLLIVRSQLREG